MKKQSKQLRKAIREYQQAKSRLDAAKQMQLRAISMSVKPLVVGIKQAMR